MRTTLNCFLCLLTLTVPALASQETASRSFGQFQVVVGPQQGSKMPLQVQWSNGETKQFSIFDLTEPTKLASRLSVYGTSRLILQSSNVIYVVDPSTGVVIDQLLSLYSSQSPGGRFLAMEHYQRNGENGGASYFVYDLDRSPEANRASASTGIGSDAGLPVYPPEQVQSQSYHPVDSPTGEHLRVSPIFWMSNQRFAFVDQQMAVRRVVITDVSSGIDAFTQTLAVLEDGLIFKPAPVPLSQLHPTIESIEQIDSSSTSMRILLRFAPGPALRGTDLEMTLPLPQ